MSFIDDALQNITSGEDFVEAMADIYSNPDVRDQLKNYPEWIRNIIAFWNAVYSYASNNLEIR
ncbi:MAG: hypothetical protein IKF31_07365 [Clostridiales bacterium]|nr:hypothetical protein [Clostridiales bacterium]